MLIVFVLEGCCQTYVQISKPNTGVTGKKSVLMKMLSTDYYDWATFQEMKELAAYYRKVSWIGFHVRMSSACDLTPVDALHSFNLTFVPYRFAIIASLLFTVCTCNRLKSIMKTSRNKRYALSSPIS